MCRLLRWSLAAAFATTAATARAGCPTTDAIELANHADMLMSVSLDDAIAMMARASKLDPSNARIHYKLARAYLKKESWAAVVREGTMATKLAPTFATYAWLVGYAQTRLNAWPEARHTLEAALVADPNLADAHFDLATTLDHLHDEQGALEHYTRAIRLAPSRVDPYIALAELYLRLGYDDRAGAVAREGLTWSPSPNAHFALATLVGSAAENRKAMPEAILRYREAKDACGTCNEHGEQVVYFNLGMALAATKPLLKDEALDNLEQFAKRVCRGGAAVHYIGECEQAMVVVRRLSP